jgi:Cystatin domain
MKNSLKFAVGLAVLTVIIGAASARAQVKTGGYKEADKGEAGVVAAAEYAIKAQSEKTGYKYELSEVVKAERQVVAGTNYRLCMQVSADGDEAFFVQAVVYLDLKKNYKLTSWADSDCGDQ